MYYHIRLSSSSEILSDLVSTNRLTHPKKNQPKNTPFSAHSNYLFTTSISIGQWGSGRIHRPTKMSLSDPVSSLLYTPQLFFSYTFSTNFFATKPPFLITAAPHSPHHHRRHFSCSPIKARQIASLHASHA
jgi:hypothetical protein